MTRPDPKTQGAGVASGERFVPRDELLERSARAATALAEAGVSPGDTVALVLRNDIAYFEATLAAGALGAYAELVTACPGRSGKIFKRRLRQPYWDGTIRNI